MTRKQVEPHIYDDVNVTTARLTMFALADRQEQTAVLAKLRERSVDDSAAITIGFSSLLLAVFVVVAAPLLALDPEPLRRLPWFITPAVVFVIAAALFALMAPAMYRTAKDQARKERATVWLGAYTDELARRHRLRGAAARRWQREH